MPDEANDMVHGIGAMPNENQQDDMSGNPLQEGILADGGWKNRAVRDESFASVRSRISLFETPEFETTQLTLPQDLYQHAMQTEATHRANIQLPKGITDNVHATLGNLQAWVANPYENGQLRPYYNKYWKVIRPSMMKPGSVQIGVADPTMAEIINHVAQTDDMTPLYQYRGTNVVAKVSDVGDILGDLVNVAAPVADVVAPEIGLPAEAAAALADGSDAAATAGDAASASGIGGMWNKLKGMMPGGAVGQGAGFEMGKNLMGQGIGYADDLLGMGGQGGLGGGGTPVHDTSFYSRQGSDEDSMHPNVHGEIPKNEDGDSQQKDDGNSHEWQRDISVNGVGGTDHSPSFDPGGPAMKGLEAAWPLIMQYLDSGADASQDQTLQAVQQALEAEIPGFQHHGDDKAGDQLIMMIRPHLKGGEAHPEHNEPTHTDENSGGVHSSKVAHLAGEGADFLPDLTVEPPSLRGAAMYPHAPSEIPSGVLHGPIHPEEEALDSASWPQNGYEHCPHCSAYMKTALGMCPQCGEEVYPHGQGQAQAMEYAARLAAGMPPGPPMGGAPMGGPPMGGPPPPASPMSQPPPMPAAPGAPDDSSQGPVTDEQQSWFAGWLEQHGRADEIPKMIANPQLYAKDFAEARQREVPPQHADDAGMSANPPMPAQENAPPGDTMPVPGMDSGSQMMSAVERYAADSVANKCPKCESHTTGLIDEEGTSQCHACKHIFKTKGLHPDKIDSTTSSTWNVDEDLRKEAEAGDASHNFDLDTGSPIQGVPIADQSHQRDRREEQDSGHTWLDEGGSPLKVGHEYEMYSDKYDIPDLIRIEAVKPASIVYTQTGEYGLGHSTELTKEEANIEGDTFRSTVHEGELGTDDSLEENNDDNTAYTGSPEQTDMSAPSGLVSASVITSGVTEEHPQRSWLMQGVPRTSGANYTAMEQRALIDEQGLARNADKLDLLGTHYVQDADENQFLFGY